MHFNCRPFIGHPSDNSWSQFWENEPDNPDSFRVRGHLFGLINISPDPSVDARTIGHELINQFTTDYYSTSDASIDSALHTAVEHLVSMPEYQALSLSLQVAVVHQSQLYICLYHSGRGVLRRGSAISTLLIGSDSVSGVSGKTVDGDQLFLCTDDFYTAFTWDQIKNYLSQDSLDSIEEDFLSQLNSLDNQTGLAAVLIEIHQDEVVNDSPVIDDFPEKSETITSSDSVVPLSATSPSFKFKLPFSSPRPVYVTHSDSPQASRRKRFNLMISVLILLALFVSSYFGYRRNSAAQMEKQYQSLKSQLETKINDASAVKNLNLDTALNLAQESSQLLSQLAPYQSTHSEEIQNFQSQVSNLLAQTGSSSGFTPEIYYDTTLIDSQLSYSKLTISGNTLYLLDPSHGRIDKLDISKKSHQTVVNSVDVQNSQSLAVNNDTVYLLQNGKIVSIDGNQITPRISLSESITDFSAGEFHFWNSSIYVLSLGSSESSIWKFAPAGTGFGTGQKWLKDSSSLPSGPTSFAINGDIWVISKTGVIVPYSLGVKKEFSSPQTVLTAASNLVTSADSNLLAFTDSGNQIYVYSKTGQSLSHYNFDSRRISSLAYDQTTNSLFVLCEDQKIYKISL